MRSKKLAAFSLAAVLSLGLLTVCSGGSDDINETPAGSTPSVTESGAPATDSPANWTSVADLEGVKIAVQEGTTGNDAVSAIPDTEVNASKAVIQCGMELINGRVNCAIVDTHPVQSLVDANPNRLMMLDFPVSEETEIYAIVTQKNDMGAILAEEFSAAMATLQENGISDALVDKHISRNEDVQLLELKTVESPKGALVMGTSCKSEPLEYLDENGDPTDFDVGFAQYLYAEIGYTLTIENMDFDALTPALQPGRIDLIAAGLTRGEEWEKNANFTDGHYEATQSIVVAKSAV